MPVDNGQSETGTDRVYRASSSNGQSSPVLHADRDCWRLNVAKNVHEKDPDVYPEDYPRCGECHG